MYPTFMYHPTLAPSGKAFVDEADLTALGPDWVDTPTKFPASPVPDGPDHAPDPESPATTGRRGRPRKERDQ